MTPAARKPAPAKKSATKKQPKDDKRPMPKKAAKAAKAAKPAKATTNKKNPRTMDETNVKAPAAAPKAAAKASSGKTAAKQKAAAKPAAPKAARKAPAKAKTTKPAAKKAAAKLAPKPTAKAPKAVSKPAAKAPKATAKPAAKPARKAPAKAPKPAARATPAKAPAPKAAPAKPAKPAAKPAAAEAPSGRDAVAAILRGKAPRPAGKGAPKPKAKAATKKAPARQPEPAEEKLSRAALLQKLLSLRAKETARTGHKAAADMRKGLPSRVPTSVAKAAEFAETRKISSMVSSAPAEQEPEPAPKKKPARRRKAPYTKTELRELREILESERVRLLKDMDVLDARKAEAEASNRTFSNHQADAATDSSAMETMFVTRRYEEERLGQVVTALERLDKGDYGLCDMCADEPQKLCESCPFIPIGRLRAKPFAKLCVPCREQMEKAKRR